MRIGQNLFYSDHLSALNKNRKKSMEKLSSGLAINRASDNAAGLSISKKLNAQVRGISQARRNIMDAQGLLEVSERGLQGVNNALLRMRELSIQAANDTLTDLDRQGIQLELNEVKQVISGTVKESEFNTHMVMGTNKTILEQDRRVVEKELGIILKETGYEQQYSSIEPYGAAKSSKGTDVINVSKKSIEVSKLELSTLVGTGQVTGDGSSLPMDPIMEEILGFSEEVLVFKSSRDHKIYPLKDDGTLREENDAYDKINFFEIISEVGYELEMNFTLSLTDNKLQLGIEESAFSHEFSVDEGEIVGFELIEGNDNKLIFHYQIEKEIESSNTEEEDSEVGATTTIKESIFKVITWTQNSEGVVFELGDAEDGFTTEERTLALEKIDVKKVISYNHEVVESVKVVDEDNSLTIGELLIMDVDVSKGFSLNKDKDSIYYVSSLDGRIYEQKFSATLSQTHNVSSSDNGFAFTFEKSLEVIADSQPSKYLKDQEWQILPDEISNLSLSEKPSLIQVFVGEGEDRTLLALDVDYGLKDDKIYFVSENILNKPYEIVYVAHQTFDGLIEDADLYDISGDKSIRIQVGNMEVPVNDIHFNKPPDESQGDYVWVQGSEISLFGKYQLAPEEELSVSYIRKDANKFDVGEVDIHTTEIEGKTLLGALQVLNEEGKEMEYLSDLGGTGYRYDSSTKKIVLEGDARLRFDGLKALKSYEVHYYNGEENDPTSTKIFLSKLPENLRDEEDFSKSIQVERNGEPIDPGQWTYEKSTYRIILEEKSRPNIRDKHDNYNYKISYVYEPEGSTIQDGKYEIYLDENNGKFIEYYHEDLEKAVIKSMLVKKNGEDTLEYKGMANNEAYNAGESGWYYDQSNKKIVLLGDARPGVFDTIKVEYLLGETTLENSTYDFILSEEPKNYGLEGHDEDYPKSIRVFVEDSTREIEYSSENGFTFETKLIGGQWRTVLSLHGDARPAGGEKPTINVFYMKDDYLLQIHDPEDEEHEINRVFIGETLETAVEVEKSNYTYEKGVVTVTGERRPNASYDSTPVDANKVNVYVKYSPPKYVEINEKTVLYNPYTDSWYETDEIKAEIPLELMKITFDSEIPLDEKYFEEDGSLSMDYFFLEDGKIRFTDDLEFTEGNHKVKIDYIANLIKGYEDQHFTFHVGANTGQGMGVNIKSFENMLFTTDQLRVETRAYADNTISILDRLIGEVSSEMGSLGAIQNRLTAASNNLSVLEENTMSAMSRIEDVDYAQEMLKQVRYSILEQTVMAMQAHQMRSGESILQLIS